MLTASTPDLDLVEVYIDSDPRGRVFPAFPINCFTGAEHTAVVYFEVAARRLPAHPHRQRRGDPLHRRRRGRGPLGDERGPVRAGDLAVIPAMVPHGIANTGDEPLKVVGFFCESEIVSTFAEPLQPMGLAR